MTDLLDPHSGGEPVPCRCDGHPNCSCGYAIGAAKASPGLAEAMRQACLAIVIEEGRGTTHGKGAWKVVQATMKMEARINLLAAQALDPVPGSERG